MKQDSERKRAGSAAKPAAHVYARKPSDKTAEDSSAGPTSAQNLGEKSFWRSLKLARTDSTKRVFQGRRHQKD